MSQRLDTSATAGTGAYESWCPQARPTSDFSMCEVGDGEMTIFDVDRLQYHTLNRPAFEIWQLCNGNNTLVDIARQHLGETSAPNLAIIEWAVIELSEACLLQSRPEDNASSSRRHVLKLAAAGLVGGALIPLVSSITAPASASHTSCGASGSDLACGVGNHCVCSAECACGCCCPTAGGSFCAFDAACSIHAACFSP
jgi:hypothetical protein